MRHASKQNKATRQTENASARDSSTGREAISMAPPAYGIDFVDQGSTAVVQRKENKTGLPGDLKAGIESASGMPMDDVKVHYNSPRPARLQALAYTQGGEIHVGPGQERHLAHEAWHVVQQRQGRVKPNVRLGDVGLNHDPTLEREADVMGERTTRSLAAFQRPVANAASADKPVQCKLPHKGKPETKGYYNATAAAKNKIYGGGRPANFSTSFKMNMVKKEWGGAYNKDTDMWYVGTHGESQVVLPTIAIQIDHQEPWDNIEKKLTEDPSTKLGANLLGFQNDGLVTAAGSNYTLYAARMYYHDVDNLKPMAGSENAAKGAGGGGGQSDLVIAWQNRAARSTGVHNQLVQAAFSALCEWDNPVDVPILLAQFDDVDNMLVKAEDYFNNYS